MAAFGSANVYGGGGVGYTFGPSSAILMKGTTTNAIVTQTRSVPGSAKKGSCCASCAGGHMCATEKKTIGAALLVAGLLLVYAFR